MNIIICVVIKTEFLSCLGECVTSSTGDAMTDLCTPFCCFPIPIPFLIYLRNPHCVVLISRPPAPKKIIVHGTTSVLNSPHIIKDAKKETPLVFFGQFFFFLLVPQAIQCKYQDFIWTERIHLQAMAVTIVSFK